MTDLPQSNYQLVARFNTENEIYSDFSHIQVTFSFIDFSGPSPNFKSSSFIEPGEEITKLRVFSQLDADKPAPYGYELMLSDDLFMSVDKAAPLVQYGIRLNKRLVRHEQRYGYYKSFEDYLAALFKLIKVKQVLFQEKDGFTATPVSNWQSVYGEVLQAAIECLPNERIYKLRA